MKLVKSLKIRHEPDEARMDLLVGDLSNTPDDHRTDLLVVSAFPDNYEPFPNTLIGALHRKGLSVQKLARHKAFDLRQDFSCWLSEELNPKKGLPFRRILCFESAQRGRAWELVGDIFRAVEPFVLGPPYLKSVAMPFVASGNQGYPIEDISRSLFSACWNRLSNGHPLKAVKFVAFSDQDAARALKVFDEILAGAPLSAPSSNERPPSAQTLSEVPESAPQGRDIFISYSRHDLSAATLVAQTLKEAGLDVFIDGEAISVGSAWQQAIFDALEECRCVLPIYSPQFVQSKVCKDEFNAALILRRRRGDDFIFPILVTPTNLPAYMEMLNYRDCCVADREKLQSAAKEVAQRLSRDRVLSPQTPSR